ncbi:hypothetical protein [[Micrococcus luteus] ATCC 49442]|uniref:hypothetical protein n=1 Tax=[Micrococcus luteus] ATCC 49442 TaxID=2698727 RepID=UPI0013DB3C0A|nr:hypothetical protein [[Micrococcus luteus] ATCC 49442]
MPKQPRTPGKESASGKEPGEDSVSHSTSDQTHEEILAYWTPERMAEAKPRELRLPERAQRPGDESTEPSPEPS